MILLTTSLKQWCKLCLIGKLKQLVEMYETYTDAESKAGRAIACYCFAFDDRINRRKYSLIIYLVCVVLSDVNCYFSMGHSKAIPVVYGWMLYNSMLFSSSFTLKVSMNADVYSHNICHLSTNAYWLHLYDQLFIWLQESLDNSWFWL